MKVAVFGCGEMASAVVKSIYKHNKQITFYTYTPSRHRAKKLADAVNGSVIASLEVLEDVEYIIIGCKPYQFNDLSSFLKKANLTNKIIVSLMAAISIPVLREKLNSDKVIRLMPSLPMKSDEGISLLQASSSVDKKSLKEFGDQLASSSQVLYLENEELFDKLTVVTASGPAYVYYFLSIFQDIIKRWGLDEKESRLIALNLFKGSSISMLNSPNSLEDEISKVTSNKGVTIEGINSFKEDELDNLIEKAIFKAHKRSLEISEDFH